MKQLRRLSLAVLGVLPILALAAKPVIEGDPSQSIRVGEQYLFQPSAQDADGDSLSFLINYKPSWAEFDPSTGTLKGTPQAYHRGLYSQVQIGATDGVSTAWLLPFDLEVENVVPSLSGTPASTAMVGKEYSFQPLINTKTDGLWFVIKRRPYWAQFDLQTGRLWGKPRAGDHREYKDIQIGVSDGWEITWLDKFSIQVANNPPSIVGAPQTLAKVDQAYYFRPDVEDVDGDMLRFTIQNKPGWANFDIRTGALSGVPHLADKNQSFSDIRIEVSDGAGGSTVLPAFTIKVTASAPPFSADKQSAFRLLQQASFGPTPESIAEVVELGIAGWIDAQLNLPSAYEASDDAHLTYLERSIELAELLEPDKNWWSKGVFNLGARAWTARDYPIAVWWENALQHPDNELMGKDQLRQRVAYALSQLIVVANTEPPLSRRGEALGVYYDILAKHALGNYRDLLGDIARNPAMGVYLSHQGNRKANPAKATRPDENFARELIQLFSVGLYEMNLDGTPNRDGNPYTLNDVGDGVVEAYSQQDIMEMSKVMTGWDLMLNFQYGSSYSYEGDYTSPMEFNPAWHSYEHRDEVALTNQDVSATDGMVTILGQEMALDALDRDGQASGLDAALDIVFNHPNVGPFVSRHLIMRLVTSNPSSAYIADVARVFNDNGHGERGDLKAVVRSILLHSEARTPDLVANPNFGKAKEPILAVTQFLRALQVKPLVGWLSVDYKLRTKGETYLFRDPEAHLGQAPMRAQSVFNFYSPDFVPSDAYFSEQGLVMPELQIQSDQVLTTMYNLFTRFFIYENNYIKYYKKMSLEEYIAPRGYWAGPYFDISFDRQFEAMELALEGDTNGDFSHMNLINAATGQPYKVEAIDALLDNLDQLFLGGTMQEDYRAALHHFLLDANGAQSRTPVIEAWFNVHNAILQIVVSSAFMIQQ